MAALTADVNMSVIGTPDLDYGSANGADTFYRGSLVYTDTGGGVQLVPAAGDRFFGISTKNQVITAAGQKVEVIAAGLVWLPVGNSVAAEDEGDFLVLDLGTVQSDNPADTESAVEATIAPNDIFIGVIRVVTSTQMEIAIHPAGYSGRIVPATATNAPL